ncbi:uncharacterized protein RSE6_04283 [Rhynchosporium secalis]|uniref:Uncharacterized protein n=1 Tax=Rhynchosporium secalis TaxID=38038 RepID=A0A1E1M4X2_RHYSE|nr:uncharacterized protein RSE6_04283 [Rhynchosporium secalis]
MIDRGRRKPLQYGSHVSRRLDGTFHTSTIYFNEETSRIMGTSNTRYEYKSQLSFAGLQILSFVSPSSPTVLTARDIETQASGTVPVRTVFYLLTAHSRLEMMNETQNAKGASSSNSHPRSERIPIASLAGIPTGVPVPICCP